ncbi:hypothetical protein ONZ43_g4250 [Nemania bipapillata]|uniref:Uncharacterized protein n=1 Tax=Nemania bipapillata TaxID=110536 RepID=A0ACC2IQ27_9PEZI|nr:hypothetical protein ONZ43_g4250 [Nemania bipapillata]
MPYQYLQPHVIHPASLDGIIQANLVPLVCNSLDPSEAFVPFYAKDLWVSSRSLDVDDSYIVSAQAERRGLLKAESTFTATSRNTGLTMVRGNGFVLKPVPGSGLQTEKRSKHVAFHMEWKTDPTLSGLMSTVEGAVDDIRPAYSLLAYEALSLDYMRSALDLDLAKEVAEMPHHRQLYLAYMKHAVENTTIKPVEYDIQKLQRTPEGALIVAVGDALPQILMGEIDPLEVFFSGKLADDFYQGAFGAERCFAQLSSYLDALTHKHPGMKFLEIGAGTGGTTKSIMKTLTHKEGRYMDYTFTDISPAFFEVARNIFREHSTRMTYKVLNIEKSVGDQGFELGQYDVIIAANVLHATQNIEITLRNTRQLLKPGGKLLLYECTNPTALNVNLVFGTLPGWWLSQEPHRAFGPLMTKEKWGEHLRSTGFTGVDAVFPDFPNPADQFGSILVSTAVDAIKAPPKLAPAFIIKMGSSPSQMAVAAQMRNTLAYEAPYTLRFEDDPVFETPLGEDEVEFKVMAIGTSSRDLATVLGQIEGDIVLGADAAGIVTRAGSESPLKAGDRVLGLSTTGTMKTYARSNHNFLTKIPDSMTWAEAASIPFAYSAAYAVLAEHGNIQDGDTILVHSAAGGFGQAAIQLAQRNGAEVFVTAGTREKQDFLHTTSGPVKAAAKAFIEELAPFCQNIAAPACDVADKQALEKCIAECSAYMPKIKGCIQASMVLNDNRFLDMSHEEWDNALRPKVDASWNLHHVLGHDLDFFVLLSSTMGIVGNKEQSNYAAGNTFLDSLARYRLSLGLPGVALDLPAIEDVGFVADKPELLESMRAAGNGSMPVEEVLAVLDYYCGLAQKALPVEKAQVILRPGLPYELIPFGIAQPAWMQDPLFSQLGQLEAEASTLSQQKAVVKKEPETATRIAAASSIAEAEDIVLNALLNKLSRVLSVESSELDPDKPLHAYGVDSLVAVDVRSWLLKDVGSEVSVFDMTAQASILRLAKTATMKNRFLPDFKGVRKDG